MLYDICKRQTTLAVSRRFFSTELSRKHLLSSLLFSKLTVLGKPAAVGYTKWFGTLLKFSKKTILQETLNKELLDRQLH